MSEPVTWQCDKLLKFFQKSLKNNESISIRDADGTTLLSKVDKMQCVPAPSSSAIEKNSFAQKSLVSASNAQGDTFEAIVETFSIGATKISKANHSIGTIFKMKQKCNFTKQECWMLFKGDETFAICANMETKDCDEVQKLIDNNEH